MGDILCSRGATNNQKQITSRLKKGSIKMERGVLTSVLVGMGIIVGLIIAVILLKVCNKNGKLKSDYDERQQIMIGKSYKCAMITAWILMAIYMIIDIGGNAIPMDNAMVIFTILFASIMVHTSYTVWTDAYFGSNNDYKKYAVLSVVVTAINIAATVAYIKDGQLIVDGVLTVRGINAECALMFLILGVEFAIKSIIDKSKASEEDDDDEES